VNGAWTYQQAEDHLASLEPFGWRFGLDRIQRLTSLLGMPQHRFASIHVVGTNGKSSVSEIATALLEAHGVRTGTYLSPHDLRWSERIRIRGEEIAPEAFAAALERVSQSIAAVNRTLADDDSVTQFEAVTAAAFVSMAAAGVEVGVIEAGLGGRLDATNVIPSKVTALTSVGLDHTQWLGETEEEIAGEKLAVLRNHSMLVLGRVSDSVAEIARKVAAERHAVLVEVPGLEELVPAAGTAPYQRRNFAVAEAAAEAAVGRLDRDRVGGVAAALDLPGRMELREGDPPVVLDSAHNPDGARALAEALPSATGARPIVACLAILADKDAAGILASLAPLIAAAVCTEIPPERFERAGRPGARAIEAGELAELARSAGIAEVEAIEGPAAAVRQALRSASGRHGVALISGSHYLLGYATEAVDASAPPPRR
jgi:dihydrofolate synthase / folylpolyglutamate synthase